MPVTLDDTSWAAKPYPEVRRIAAEPGSVLLVPVGSLEQHGRHLPTVTDAALADAVANLGAQRVGDRIPVLVTPVQRVGHSPMHLDSFGGTLSLPLEGLVGVLESIGRTGLDNGFDALVLVNGHGGNGPAVDGAVSKLGAAYPDVEVLGLTYYHLVSEFADEVRESASGGMSHGGELETSLMLHLYPELVREDEVGEWERRDMPYRHAAADMTESGPINVYRSSDRYSASGVEGDPSVASAGTGEEVYDRLGDEFEALLEDLHDAVTADTEP
jgi:creatinine amidohydrolase